MAHTEPRIRASGAISVGVHHGHITQRLQEQPPRRSTACCGTRRQLQHFQQPDRREAIRALSLGNL